MTFKSGRGEKKNKGGGMPAIKDERFRRVTLCCRIPAWLYDWLKVRGSVGKTVENAIRRRYGPPEPK